MSVVGLPASFPAPPCKEGILRRSSERSMRHLPSIFPGTVERAPAPTMHYLEQNERVQRFEEHMRGPPDRDAGRCRCNAPLNSAKELKAVQHDQSTVCTRRD